MQSFIEDLLNSTPVELTANIISWFVIFVVVVSHDFANGLLRRHCSDFIPVQPYGLYWKDMKNTQFFTGRRRYCMRNQPSYKQLELNSEETGKEP